MSSGLSYVKDFPSCLGLSHVPLCISPLIHSASLLLELQHLYAVLHLPPSPPSLTPPHSPAFQSHCGSFSLILHEAEPSGKASLLWVREQAAFARQLGGYDQLNPCLGFQRPQPQALWASFFPRDSISTKGGLEGAGGGFPALADAGRRRLLMVELQLHMPALVRPVRREPE